MASQKRVSVLLEAIDNISGPVGGALKRVDSFVDGVVRVGKAIAAAFVAGVVGNFFKESVTEGLKAEDSYRRIGAAVKNTGNDFAAWKPQIDATVDSVQKLSNQTDDDLRGALTKLISTTGDVNGSMKNLGLVADVAAERQISLNDAAVLVGKTMNGNLTPLTKAYGVEVRSAAEGVALLHEKTDGFAKTATEGMGGALTNLSIQWGELKEAVGLAIIGSDNAKVGIGGLADKLIVLQQWVAANSETIGGFVGSLVEGFTWLISKVTDFIGGIQLMAVDAALAWDTLGSHFKKLLGQLMIFFSGFLGQNRILLTIFGDGLTTIADEMGDAGVRMVRESTRKLVEIKGVREEMYASIVGTAAKTETALTTGTAKGSRDRIVLTKAEKAEIEKVEKASAASLAKLRLELDEAAAKAALALLDSQHRAVAELTHQFALAMKNMQADERNEAEALLAAHLLKLNKSWGFLHQHMIIDGKIAWSTEREQTVLTKGVTEDFTAVLDKHGKKVDENTVKTIEGKIRWAEFKEEAAQVAFTLMDGADAMLAFMDALGLGDEKMDRLVAGVGDLAEGIGRLASGDIVGGLLKGIGGIKDVIGGLFGESKSERELREALDRNRNRLEELTDEIGDLNINLTGKQLAGTQGALKEFFATGGANAKGWGDRLGGLLLKRGVNMSDLEEVAKTLQIELRPSGHLSPQMLQQLMQAIGLVEPTTFRQDFRGKKDQLAAETELFDLSPEEQAKRLAAIGAGELTGATAAKIGGLGFASAEARTTSLGTIQGLFNLMKSGGIATAELGGLKPSEFLALLGDLKDLIESVNDAAAADGGAAPNVAAGAPAPASTAPAVPVAIIPTGDSGVASIPIFDLGGAALGHLASIDFGIAELLADVTRQAGVGAAGFGAVGELHIDARQQNEITLNLSAVTAADPRAIATEVAGTLRRLQAEQLLAIQEGLASDFLLDKRRRGDATWTGQ